MDDDGSGNALEAFKALHHPERKAAEKLLISNGLRDAEKRKMRQYGHLDYRYDEEDDESLYS